MGAVMGTLFALGYFLGVRVTTGEADERAGKISVLVGFCFACLFLTRATQHNCFLLLEIRATDQKLTCSRFV